MYLNGEGLAGEVDFCAGLKITAKQFPLTEALDIAQKWPFTL